MSLALASCIQHRMCLLHQSSQSKLKLGLKGKTRKGLQIGPKGQGLMVTLSGKVTTIKYWHLYMLLTLERTMFGLLSLKCSTVAAKLSSLAPTS